MAAAAYSVGALKLGGAPPTTRSALPQMVATAPQRVADEISKDAPLKVLIAGAGVGGLALANQLELSQAHVEYTVLERTSEFRKFGGPIQLASNAMQALKSLDAELYSEIEARATWTGNRTNGIKDGIRNEWYAKFDLMTPAADRSMPFTCVVERPVLQDGSEVEGDVLIGADGIRNEWYAKFDLMTPA